MDKTTDNYAKFWEYLSQNQKDLIQEGQYMMRDVLGDHVHLKFKDYSFIVFPFAKAYEGFLKELFKDIKFISHLDYISDHLRLGKLLSPYLIGRLGDKSLYKKIEQSSSKELADKIWQTWKIGRNQVFHYYPHNLKALTFEEAEVIVNQIIQMMEEAYTTLNHKSETLNPKQYQNPNF